jgi:iron complex transport system permease protein
MSTLVAPARARLAPDTRPWPVRAFGLILVVSLALVFALIVVHVSIGTVGVTPGQVLDVFATQLHLSNVAVDPLNVTVIWHLRLPRALIAVVAGAMLALAGAILQAITGNPLAEPDLTGASAGGVFFAVLWLSRDLVGWDVGAPGLELPAVALIGSLSAGALVYFLSRQQHTNTVRLILTGVLVATILRSLTSLILLRNQNATGSILMWIIGSLNGRTWVHWDAVWPWAAVTIPLGLLCASRANVIHLGDDVAAGLGLRVEWNRFVLLGVAVLLTAGAVSVVGALGFLGLIAPHVTRRLVGQDARRVFPLSAVFGAGLLLIADITGRALVTVVDLPVGAVMALIGGPFLMYLLRRGTR